MVVGTHGHGVYSTNIITSVEQLDDQPAIFALDQNYPNPFNPSTKINYSLPADGHVLLKVYDATVREIRTLVDSYQEAGKYQADFDGRGLASGVYICRIQAGKFSAVKKMTLIK